MICHESRALVGGFIGGFAIGLSMTAFAVIFLTMKYRALMRRRA